MVAVAFDMREFELKARQMGIFRRDQLPFAIARTINDTMFKGVRPAIVDKLYPSVFTVRNRRFPRWAFHVEPDKGASKGNLSASFVERSGRAQMARHASGGTKPARGSLAIPEQSKVKLTASGAKPRPRALDARFPKRALRVIPGKGIFVGRGGRLHLWYLFRPSAKISKRFPFYETFTATVMRDMPIFYPPNIRRAVATAFGR